ncbi:MAG: prolipoprotein diacylglyceryl transferase [Desulfovibrionaceae bacterium]|nr:prolipoprotein diacylglyceryl transferase [Desulfovibrionaceae bacterium]
MIQNPDIAHAVHTFFEAAAMMIGARYYFILRRAQALPPATHGQSFIILLGCLAGASVGNKLMFWLEAPHLWTDGSGWRDFLFGGQSMVGGLLGGLIGVELGKKLCGYQSSTGDLFVFPILLGLMIGRVGCFLAGLDDGTYGVPTSLPWGVDFGDGLPRHPAQLYEIIFAGLLWRLLKHWQPRLKAVPGAMFRLMLIAYLLWRLGIDSLKPVSYVYALGLSGIQWACLLALLCYVPLSLPPLRKALSTMETRP